MCFAYNLIQANLGQSIRIFINITVQFADQNGCGYTL